MGGRPAPPTLLIRGVEVAGRIVDVGCAGGSISQVTDAGGADGRGADLVIEGRGGALLPGLHDHHVHLMALAAARRSVLLGPPDVGDAATFDAAVRAAAAIGEGWIRGVGFHESVAGPLDRWRLDELAPGRPVHVRHHGGAMWVLNTAALELTGIDRLGAPGIERDSDGEPTGRLFRLDRLLRERVGTTTPDLAGIARELAGYGVTAVCDMTPTEDEEELEVLAAAAHGPGFPIDVVVSGGPGLAAGAAPDLRRGPVKFVLDDDRLPSLEELVAGLRVARRAGRAIAVHCVTRAELVVALAALDEVGPHAGDRIEHGAVIPAELIPELRSRRLIVVTQPSFVAERGDQYLADVDADDVGHLWRCRSLIEAGVGVAGGSDTPFGHPNPWRAVAAAVARTTPAGAVLGPGERLPAARALDLFLTPLDRPAGPARRVAVGEPADLCLLAEPLAATLADPATAAVVTTVRAGVPTS